MKGLLRFRSFLALEFLTEFFYRDFQFLAKRAAQPRDFRLDFLAQLLNLLEKLRDRFRQILHAHGLTAEMTQGAATFLRGLDLSDGAPVEPAQPEPAARALF